MGSLRCTLVCLGLSAFTLGACGSRPAEGHRTTTVDGPAEEPDAPPSEPVHVEGMQYSCVLQLLAGVLNADCERGGALTCTEAHRGDLTEHPGDEVVYACHGEDGPDARVLAVAAANTIAWALPLSDVDDMCVVTGVSTSLVDAIEGARQALLLQVRDCIEPGELADIDVLYTWQTDHMAVAAEHRLSCTFMGDTSDPDADPPPAGATYMCGGGYLEIAGGPAVSRTQVEEATTGSERDDGGRMLLPGSQTIPLRWDATAGRFTDSAPRP